MKIKTKLIIAVAMVSLLFVATNKGNAVDFNDKPITFVKTGNEWEYGFYKDNELVDTKKFKIISENNGCFKTNFDDSYDSYWYVNDEYWKTHTNELGEDGFISLYKNTFLWQKWDATYKKEYTMEVISCAETITVPAGTWTCIKVKMTHKETGEIAQNWWFHKDIGIVLREVVIGEGSMFMKLHSKNF